jgi:hypothetical protein
MNNLINNFKTIILSKNEVEGYILSEDKIKNTSLVLVKENNMFWKTKWLNNAETIYKIPMDSISLIFKN